MDEYEQIVEEDLNGGSEGENDNQRGNRVTFHDVT